MIKKTSIAILLLSVLMASTLLISANATVDIIPPKPKALQTIEVTAQITDENVNAVHVEIQECNANNGLCYSKENYSMTETTPNVYTTQASLSHDDATYLQYTILVQTNQGWVEYEKETKVNYDVSSSNNGNNDNDTPGFEFITLSLSIIFISFILYRRKR